MFLEVSTQKIRQRIVIVGSVLIIAPMIVVVLAGWLILQRMEQVAARAENSHHPKPSSSGVDLSQQTLNLIEACRKYYEASVDALKHAGAVFDSAGGTVHLDGSHMVVWHAFNEVTGERKSFEIPLLSAGDARLEATSSFDKPVPVVDEIEKMAGTPATIFQRLNDRGDMLRIASSLKSEKGTRAINTFVLAEERTGESAKILQTVLSGQTYLGKEVQGKVSYLTSYKPLKNSWGKVVGMLNTVVPEEQIRKQVRHLATTAGTTVNAEKRQVFIYEASGENRGTLVATHDASLEGRNLWNDKDSAGRSYVQDICARALQLRSNEWAEYKFEKTNRLGGIPRPTTAQFAFVPELDWVVGFAQQETGLQANLPATSLLAWAAWLLFGLSVASTGLAVRVWIQFSDDLAPKLDSLLAHLRKDAKQLTEAAVELSHDAEHALVEMRAKADLEVKQTMPVPLQIVAEKQSHAGDAHRALQHINASSAWIGELLDAIDEITYATNHLMVNAALESPTSPNGGQAIADSADELRVLVQRCRQAARTAQTELRQSRTVLQDGSLDLAATMARRVTPALALAPMAPSSGDQAAAALRRHTENLLRLAAGIDSSLKSARAEVGVAEEADVTADS